MEELGVVGKVILKWIFRKWDRGPDWIDLAQERDKLWVVVNVVMNLCVS